MKYALIITCHKAPTGVYEFDSEDRAKAVGQELVNCGGPENGWGFAVSRLMPGDSLAMVGV